MLVDFGNRIVNTDHIVSMELVEGDHSTRWTVTLTRGESFVVADEVGRIRAFLGTIVPAQPGYSVIEVFIPKADDPDRTRVYRESTILAFRVGPGPDAPVPITVDGELHPFGGLILVVRDPDGRCVWDGATWGTFDAFKADIEREEASPEDRTTSQPAAGLAQAATPIAGTSLAPSQPTIGQAAGADPVLALRARILSESIQAVGRTALWRPGLAPVDVIDAVRRAYPDLHTNGVGYSPKWGWKWERGDQEKARADMTAGGNVEAFEAALRFLSHAGRQFVQARVNRKRTSYSWKHAAERVMGNYVPNGMLIAAAYALGFQVEAEKDSPNPCINLSEKAVALDPGKGLY